MEEKQNSIFKEIVSWIKTIALAVIVALFITRVIIVNAEVPTGSMKTTIMPGDRLIANRLAYIFSDIERGDIVVFPYPDDETILYVKRVIGLPGDVIEIVDGKVFVNGEELDEPYVSSTIIDFTKNSGPYIVPEEHLFMMGDNRANSEDSRYWKNTYLEKEKVIGKAMFTYFPRVSVLK